MSSPARSAAEQVDWLQDIDVEALAREALRMTVAKAHLPIPDDECDEDGEWYSRLVAFGDLLQCFEMLLAEQARRVGLGAQVPGHLESCLAVWRRDLAGL